MADPLVDLLLKHEGLRLHPYDDVTGKPPETLQGKITIGVGRNLTDVGITRTEALSLLKADIHDLAARGPRGKCSRTAPATPRAGPLRSGIGRRN